MNDDKAIEALAEAVCDLIPGAQMANTGDRMTFEHIAQAIADSDPGSPLYKALEGVRWGRCDETCEALKLAKEIWDEQAKYESDAEEAEIARAQAAYERQEAYDQEQEYLEGGEQG